MTRVGNFSSSSVHTLIKKGRGSDFSAPGLTYIREKLYERMLGRELTNEQSSKATSWGNVLEYYVADNKIEGLNFKPDSDEVDNRLGIEELNLSGALDLIPREENSNVFGEIKSPYTLKSFCEMIISIQSGTFKEDKPAYYWQMVSNSILSGCSKCEFYVFVPFKEELKEILSEDSLEWDSKHPDAVNYSKERLKWLKEDECPYLIKGGVFQDLNKFVFDIPQEDRNFLIERLKLASVLLENLAK